jgi:hypothetical protein
VDNETKPNKGLIGRLIDRLNSATDRQVVLFLVTCIIVGLAIYAGFIVWALLP